MKLIFDDVWQTLAAAWNFGPRHVAVAYFACDDDLSFGEGDVLVVNAGDGAVQGGLTDALAVRRAFESGADVYSIEKLHAKVFVLGNQIFVGSANASINSRTELTEAVAVSDDPFAVGEGMNFVRALASKAKRVDEAYLEHIQSLEVKARPRGAGTRTRITVPAPKYWLLGLMPDEYPGDMAEADTVSEEVKADAPRGHIADWFFFRPGKSQFYKEAKEGDSFIQVWSKKGKRDGRGVRVTRPIVISRVVVDDDGVKRFHYSASKMTIENVLTWRVFESLIREAGWEGILSFRPRREIPAEVGKNLTRLWPRK